jgi:HAD superfamily hydrolase (TIGR01450 family)
LKEAQRVFRNRKDGAALSGKKLFIFDLDGTVLLGDSPSPNVKKCLKYLLKKNKSVVFLTNNSAFSKQQHITRLEKLLDMNIATSSLHTSIDDTVTYFRSVNMERLFLMATPPVEAEFKAHGFTINADNPQAVVVTFDKTLTYQKLAEASILLQKHPELPFVLTNRDVKCPTENGFIPDAGSISCLLEMASGHKINTYRGKPNPEMITDIINAHKLPKDDAVFFGDRLYTDVVLGKNSGVTTVLMLTGETKLSELELSFFDEHLVFSDFGELLDFIQRSRS